MPGARTKPFSLRIAAPRMARLEAHSRMRGESKSRTAERLIEEGLRMADHPGIVFRDGPSGRRAALAAGPDVWEVIDTLQRVDATGEQAIAAVAEWGSLSDAQVRIALRYYVEYRDEIDERIRLNREEADRTFAEHERMREALG